MVVIKDRNRDKNALPLVLVILISFVLLIIGFVYYAEITNENITILSQIKDFLASIAEVVKTIGK